MSLFRFSTLLLTIACTTTSAQAADIHVAVASNFLGTLNKLAAEFETEHPEHRLLISSGSSGKLYAQIMHGAPYDVFLSADRERPRDLHTQGLADTPVTYAIGRLVLYAPQGQPLERLQRDEFQHLAIANPNTAPYGAGARDALRHMQLWNRLQPRLAIGENIGHAFQFVHSGSAQLGFVALTQVRSISAATDTYWEVPPDRHASLEQQACLLRRSAVPEAAGLFLAYLRGDRARSVITQDGYGLP